MEIMWAITVTVKSMKRLHQNRWRQNMMLQIICCKIWCYVSNYYKATLPRALDIALVFLWLTLNRFLSNEHLSAIHFLGKLDRTCQILYFLYDYSSESEMNMNIFPKDWNKEIFSHQSFSCMNKIPQRRSIMP